jgi:ABC-2 type transport system ATP-binding protein
MAKQKGIAVFLSSHQLHEVQRICDRVGIMSRGKMVLEGTVSELTASQDGGFEVYLEVQKSNKQLIDAISNMKSVTSVINNGNKLTISSSVDIRNQVSEIAFEQKAGLVELRASNRSLEEIYLRYFQEPAGGDS